MLTINNAIIVSRNGTSIKSLTRVILCIITAYILKAVYRLKINAAAVLIWLQKINIRNISVADQIIDSLIVVAGMSSFTMWYNLAFCELYSNWSDWVYRSPYIIPETWLNLKWKSCTYWEETWLVGAWIKIYIRHTENIQSLPLVNLDLQGTWLVNSDMQGTWLVNLDLQGTWLVNLDIQGTWLVNLDLQGTWLVNLDLQGTWLVNLDLQGTWLVNLDLQGTWLVNREDATYLIGQNID